MFPALPKSSIAKRYQGAHSNEASIAMLLIGFSLYKSTHTSIVVVDEVYKVFAYTVQARWQALIFDSIQMRARLAFLPRLASA